MIHSAQINPLCYHVVAIILTATIIHDTDIWEYAEEYVQDGIEAFMMDVGLDIKDFEQHIYGKYAVYVIK